MPGNNKPNIILRAIKFAIPQGYLLGRTSPGIGPVELIPLSGGAGNDVTAKIKESGQLKINGNYVVQLEYALVGSLALDVDQYYFLGMVPATATWPTTNALVPDKAKCLIAPLIDVTFYLVNNYATYIASGYPTGVVATIVFSAGQTAGVVTWLSGSVEIAAQTSLYLFTSPTFTDKTIQGVQLLLAGDYVNG